MIDPEIVLLQNYLTVGALVFGIGLIGFVARRNLIVVFLSAEMMLQGVSISLVAWSRYHDHWNGQVLVLFVIAIAACEAAIALALVLMLFRRSGTLDMTHWQQLREANQKDFVDYEVPAATEEEKTWPHLTPAGVEPEWDEEEEWHRTHV